MSIDAEGPSEAESFLALLPQERIQRLERLHPHLVIQEGARLGGSSHRTTFKRRIETTLLAAPEITRVVAKTQQEVGGRILKERKRTRNANLVGVVGGSAVLVALGQEWKLFGYVSGGLALLSNLLSIPAVSSVADGSTLGQFWEKLSRTTSEFQSKHSDLALEHAGFDYKNQPDGSDALRELWKQTESLTRELAVIQGLWLQEPKKAS